MCVCVPSHSCVLVADLSDRYFRSTSAAAAVRGTTIIVSGRMWLLYCQVGSDWLKILPPPANPGDPSYIPPSNRAPQLYVSSS